MLRTKLLLATVGPVAALVLSPPSVAATPEPPARALEILRLGPETVLMKIRCAASTTGPGAIEQGEWVAYAGRRKVALGGFECWGAEDSWWPETWPGQLRGARAFARAKRLTVRLREMGDTHMVPIAPPQTAPIAGWSLYWKSEHLGPEDGVSEGARDGNRAPGLWVSARSRSPKRCDWEVWLAGGATNVGSTDEDPTTTMVTFLVDGKVLLQAPMASQVGEERIGVRLRRVLPRGRRILTVVARDAQGATTTQRTRLTCVVSKHYHPRR